MDTGQEQVIKELVSLVGETFDLISSLNDELARTTFIPHHIREERSRKIKVLKECHARIVQYLG